MADNSVTLVGNLTRDPELRFTTGGKGITPSSGVDGPAACFSPPATAAAADRTRAP